MPPNGKSDKIGVALNGLGLGDMPEDVVPDTIWKDAGSPATRCYR